MKNTVPKKILVSTHLENSPVKVSKSIHTSSFELHWHDFFEIEIITGGKGVQILNGKEYPIRKGQISLLTTTDFHEFITSSEYRQYNIRISESVISETNLEKLISLNENIICYLDDKTLKKAIYLAELIDMEKDEPDEHYMCNLIDCLITLILKNFRKTGSVEQKTSKMLMHKASLYMRMHFRENLPLNNIASYVNLNPSYFCRFFANEIGMSPKKYLAGLRLEYAKKLLKTTNANVTEICFASGYTSLSNFLKSFKLKYGLTPKQMRNNSFTK